MPEALKKKTLYEVMALVDPAKARQGLEDTISELSELVVRAGGEMINMARWADRELAYPIRKNHQKFTRAVYLQGHFNGSGDVVAAFERISRNTDWVVRTLVIRDEDGTEVPGTPTSEEAPAAAKATGEKKEDAQPAKEEKADTPDAGEDASTEVDESAGASEEGKEGE